MRAEKPGRIFTPFTLAERFHIVPPGYDGPAPDGRILIRMAPGAFGSGEHETTAACLKLLADLPAPVGWNILDLGSGTGILAIAALLSGAGQALCIDNDPEATRCCQWNAGFNGVDNRLTAITGTLGDVPTGQFELVLANIYGDLLLDLAESLAARTTPGASMILSGILHEQLFDIKKRYTSLRCSIIASRILGEFTALHLRKD